MAEDEDFVWKGQEPMDVRSCQFRHPAGFRPHHILQLDPPSSITSLAINTEWGLVAAGNTNFQLFSFYNLNKNMFQVPRLDLSFLILSVIK